MSDRDGQMERADRHSSVTGNVRCDGESKCDRLGLGKEDADAKHEEKEENEEKRINCLRQVGSEEPVHLWSKRHLFVQLDEFCYGGWLETHRTCPSLLFHTHVRIRMARQIYISRFFCWAEKAFA